MRDNPEVPRNYGPDEWLVWCYDPTRGGAFTRYLVRLDPAEFMSGKSKENLAIEQAERRFSRGGLKRFHRALPAVDSPRGKIFEQSDVEAYAHALRHLNLSVSLGEEQDSIRIESKHLVVDIFVDTDFLLPIRDAAGDETFQPLFTVTSYQDTPGTRDEPSDVIDIDHCQTVSLMEAVKEALGVIVIATMGAFRENKAMDETMKDQRQP